MTQEEAAARRRLLREEKREADGRSPPKKRKRKRSLSAAAAPTAAAAQAAAAEVDVGDDVEVDAGDDQRDLLGAGDDQPPQPHPPSEDPPAALPSAGLTEQPAGLTEQPDDQMDDAPTQRWEGDGAISWHFQPGIFRKRCRASPPGGPLAQATRLRYGYRPQAPRPLRCLLV